VTIQPAVLEALVTIIIVLIVVVGLVAILAPPALATFVRPMLDTINKLIDKLAGRDVDKP